MKRLLLLAIGSLALVTTTFAQDDPRPAKRDAAPTPSLRRDVSPESTGLTQTPEMWFYEQERTHWENPQEAVRRKAEFRYSQRAQRMASAHWYGMSNSRPTANPTPLSGSYSPAWVSSNTFDRNGWRVGRDTSNTTVIVR